MWLLKAGGCLIQFKYTSLWILGQLSSGCLIQVGCLIEVTTNTGSTVVDNFKSCALSGFSSQFNKKSQGKKQHRYNQHPGDNNRYNQHPSDNNRYNQHPSDNNNEQCFKCGLTNHKTHQCFHKNQVQCFLCKFFGHKDKFCWNQ